MTTTYPLVPAQTPFDYNVGINYESWENGRTGYSITADLAAITQNFQLIKTYHDTAVGTADPSTPQIDPTQQSVISYITGTTGVELVMGTNNSALAQGGYGTPWSAGLMTSSTYTDAWVQMLITAFGSTANVKTYLTTILLGNEVDANGPPPGDPNFASYAGWIESAFTNLQTSLASAGLGDIPVSTTIANYGTSNTIATGITSYIQSNWSSSWNSNSPFVLYNQYTQATSSGPMSSTDYTPVETYFQSVENALQGATDVFVGETGYSTYYNTSTANNQATVYNQIFSWLDGMWNANNGVTLPLFAFDAFDQPSYGDNVEQYFGIYAQTATSQPNGLKPGITLPSWLSTTTAGAVSPDVVDNVVSAVRGGDLSTLEMLVHGGLRVLPGDSASLGALVTSLWNLDVMGSNIGSQAWTSFKSQLATVFSDQGLTQPADLTDLLRHAAVLAPGAFNTVATADLADAGYDALTSLGAPNGLLLARALTAIVQAETHFHTPDVLTAHGTGWDSTVAQNLLFQPIFSDTIHGEITVGGVTHGYDSGPSSNVAWTSQFAQQTLQSSFSPDLALMFDAKSQAAPLQMTVQAGSAVQVALDGAATAAPDAAASSAFGFVDFVSADASSAIAVARPVAVAQTAGAVDDTTAEVRMRQVGAADEHVLFFKVDDYAGDIGGLAPGQAGYDAAVLSRAYTTTDGQTWIAGPGYGQYGESTLAHVDAGDLIAMALTSGGHTYYAFSSANPDGAAHLWNYGLNTWGWEDLYGGGDHDYNDLVVQLDFTSSAGHGHLL